jgi:hypothetical protein
MNEPDLELFEQELRALRPAAPPPDLMTRLGCAQPSVAPLSASRRSASLSSPGADIFGRFIRWPFLLRWLIPAAALALAVGLVWPMVVKHSHPKTARRAAAPPGMLRADSVRLDQQLVGTFEAVGRLPDGEPVRFRYQQWMDQLVVKDDTSGVVIQQRTPRVEVIPVGLETY